MKASGASLGIAILAMAFFSVVDVVIFRGMHDRDSLEAKNSCEATMNSLFASLRDHDNFGSAIESSPELSASIVGLGVYAASGSRIYAWGSTPDTYSAPPGVVPEREAPIRYYAENAKNNSFVLLLHPFRLPPPGPKGPRPDGPLRQAGEANGVAQPEEHSFFFDTLKNAEVVYLEIRQAGYWSAQRFRSFFFPVTEALILVLVFFVRGLILRNADYRRRIEEQRNLVVLGTAASTLAHEIKNPLLSIRLQSSILEKLCPEEARRELAIINDEVDRLSALTYRVNDYLREPCGRPQDLDVVPALGEVCVRLAGHDLVAASGRGPFVVRIDPERLRSMAENILRNALESGGPEEGVSVEVSREEGKVRIDFLDRGTGISEEDKGRVFDPFFSTKSRGTGIGLAISKRFAEAARGAVGISDREGGGCRVSLTLPPSPQKE